MQHEAAYLANQHARIRNETMLREAFRQSQHRLVPTIAALRDRLHAMQSPDGTYPVHTLTQATTAPVQRAIRGEIAAFAIVAATLTHAAIAQAAQRGIQQAQAQTRIIAPSASIAIPDASQYPDYGGYDQFSTQATDKASQALSSGVLLNRDPGIITTAVYAAIGVALVRALVIDRTESMGAYRDGALLTFRVNSEIVGQWAWVAGVNACPFCISMDGTVHDLSEDMESHVNCECIPVPVSNLSLDEAA